jgi:hypothetical protein
LEQAMLDISSIPEMRETLVPSFLKS